ncbi:DinB family protein [Streptomyces sp. MI02-7b]|uniref:DinB family protein n=1 Tax=Streptomyces sp. MI02-7b TaxID=462941 RepID=UPI0029A38A77|nr:DinB family protein [Streptomyces sp. MI02-7b]MDX3072879.1 DinB family protein [Streptomyces sp. MI02-7b]
MDAQPRTAPSTTAGDRASLVAFLDHQRGTLAMKCAGLTGDQLRRKAVPPSGLSLLGLVRHAVEVERIWFRLVWGGADIAPYWGPKRDGAYAEFDVQSADPDEALTAWQQECAHSRAVVEDATSLDATVRWRDETYSLRYIVTHMIEEYARHNGHADLLRERLDGSTGE